MHNGMEMRMQSVPLPKFGFMQLAGGRGVEVFGRDEFGPKVKPGDR